MKTFQMMLAVSGVVAIVACSQDGSGTRPTPIQNLALPHGLTQVAGQGGGSSPLAATIQFGLTDVGSSFPPAANHDQSAHARDTLVPGSVVIDPGGTVVFDVPAGVHQIAIYAPGTKPEDIDTTNLVALCPGQTPRLINDMNNRVALITHACGSDWQAQYTFNTPGRYLVICAFLPHFEVGMYGWVEVRER
jgi:plastocyanin